MLTRTGGIGDNLGDTYLTREHSAMFTFAKYSELLL